MKKLVLTGVLSLLILTGCGKKETIVCTKHEKISGIDVNTTTNIYLESSRFKGIDAEYDITVPESMLSHKDLYVSTLEKTYKSYGEKIGATIETVETDKGAKVTMKMTAEQAKKFSGSKNDKASRKDVITEFGKQGFECK